MIGVIFVSFLYSQVDSLIDTNRVDTTTFATYKLTDFRMPESGAMKFVLNLNAGLNDNAGSFWRFPYYPDEDTFLVVIKNQGRDGSTGCNIFFERDKENFSYYVNSDLKVSALSSNESRLSDMTESDTLIKAKARFSGGDLGIYGKIQYYPAGDIFYIGLRSSLDNGCLFTRKENSFEVDTLLYAGVELERSYGDTLYIYPELGFGRMRSLSYASNAMEIAEVLQRKYTAARNPQLVKEVAELYAKRWEYPIKYWHPNWEFYEDLEEIFTKYGIPREEMNIKDWMEVIDASSIWYSRNCGFTLKFMNAELRQIFYTHSRRDLDPWSIHYTESIDLLSLSLLPTAASISCGFPISINTNLNGSIDFKLYPGLEFAFSHYGYRNSYWPEYVKKDTTIINTEIKGYGVIYEISSPTYIWNHLEISPEIRGGFGKAPQSYNESITRLWINNGVSLSARYYFTNKFAFGVSGGMYVGFERINSLPFTYSLYPNADLSLDYRIS